MSPMQCEIEMDFLDPQDSVASRDLLMQASMSDTNGADQPGSPVNAAGSPQKKPARRMVKPKGQKKEYETVKLPNYLRKQRQKEMENNTNYFDQVTQGMQQEGMSDVVDFLSQLQKKKQAVQ